jgi:hypothetical protein
MTTVLLRHFKLEVHPETGQHRVVGYTPDPDTMLPVRTSEGAWADPIDTVKTAAGHWETRRRWPVGEGRPAGEGRSAAEAAPADAGSDDPEGWR